MQPGLYVLQRITAFKTHVGILAVGYLLEGRELFGDVDGRRPLGVLIHFTPDGVRREVLYELGEWTVARKIEQNETAALARLNQVLAQNPRYDVAFRNCEHLVSLVETGEPKSPQVQGWVLTGLAVALLWGLAA